MVGLKFQKEKANQAAFKVGELKGALEQYEKVNSVPLKVEIAKLQPMEEAVTQDMVYDSLTSITLKEAPMSVMKPQTLKKL